MKDKLGEYKVLNSTNGKPTTIEYTIGCKFCKSNFKVIGSLTTRKKTLGLGGLVCTNCGRIIPRKSRGDL